MDGMLLVIIIYCVLDMEVKHKIQNSRLQIDNYQCMPVVMPNKIMLYTDSCTHNIPSKLKYNSCWDIMGVVKRLPLYISVLIAIVVYVYKEMR